MEVTPSKYLNSVLVTSDTAILPSASDTTAREASKVSVSMVDAAPEIDELDASQDPAPSPSDVHTWPFVPAEGIKYSNSDYHTPIAVSYTHLTLPTNREV